MTEVTSVLKIFCAAVHDCMKLRDTKYTRFKKVNRISTFENGQHGSTKTSIETVAEGDPTLTPKGFGGSGGGIASFGE
jgi:hypothetical protein